MRSKTPISKEAQEAFAAYWAGSIGASVAKSVANGSAKGYSEKSRKNAQIQLERYRKGLI